LAVGEGVGEALARAGLLLLTSPDAAGLAASLERPEPLAEAAGLPLAAAVREG